MHASDNKNNMMHSSVFEELQFVRKCGQTLCQVFDISSQSKLNLHCKQKMES